MSCLGIYYVIRHKATGELMPELKRGRGYSWWNPALPMQLNPKKLTGQYMKLMQRHMLTAARWYLTLQSLIFIMEDG